MRIEGPVFGTWAKDFFGPEAEAGLFPKVDLPVPDNARDA